MKIHAYCARKELNYSTQLIHQAAQARNIHFKLLAHYQHHVAHELYTLSDQGRTHLMDITRPDTASATAFCITKNKYVSQLYMKPFKLPHTDAQCFNDVEVALHHFKKMKTPCTIKPAVGTDGQGISLNIQTTQAFCDAFQKALHWYPAVIVETYFDCPDYRLLFINHRCLAISQRLPAFVDGDGENDIKTLIAQTNANRAEGRRGPLSKIRVDDDMITHLQSQGLGMGCVPQAGERVFVRAEPNMDLGGVGINLDAQLHPDNHAMLSQLTESLGLNVAAIDIMMDDPAAPFNDKKHRSAILEIISRPRIRAEEAPFAGTPVAAADAIIDMLFPETMNPHKAATTHAAKSRAL